MTVHITHPLAEWLDANNIDWRKVPAWPRVEVDYDAQTISIEEWDNDKNGRPKVYKAGGYILSKMSPYPMTVPPFPPTLAEYQQVRLYEKLVQDMGRALSRLGYASQHVPPGPCPSVSPGVAIHPEFGELQRWCVLRAGHFGDHESDRDAGGYARWKEMH